MQINKIKTKKILEYGSGGGSMKIGFKIIIKTTEEQGLSIIEIEKIKDFFETLRN